MRSNSESPNPVSANRLPLSALLVIALAGCSSWRLHSHWSAGGGPPSLILPVAQDSPQSHFDPPVELDFDTSVSRARSHLAAAERLAAVGDPACVDEFYVASVVSWSAYQQACALSESRGPSGASELELHRRCLARLIHEGHALGRLDPAAGLTIVKAGKSRMVPCRFHGFAWQPEDFQEWLVVGSYSHRSISRSITSPGVGVPLVIVHNSSPSEQASDFLLSASSFGATAVLQPDGSALDLYNPLCETACCLGSEKFPLARDLTASVVYGLHAHAQSSLEGFLRPGDPHDAAKLYFLEPYQPGKIPLVLVHGLLSNPDTWADIYNELLAHPELMERYQVWAFRYSTGAPFVRSASELRSFLNRVQTRFDPDGCNGALRSTVLVGHSMGGLISRLMVSSSGEEVWDSIANLPLERVATNEPTRATLAERLYFDPSPLVQRVVFIATPHRGSGLAGRAIGKVAETLITQNDPAYEQLKQDNVGGFKESVTRRLPTSIDLLNPEEPFLGTIQRLRFSRRVHLHSIIGTGVPPLMPGGSDGVVTVESAHLEGVESEAQVAATHTGILRDPQTVEELIRILRVHAYLPVAQSTEVLPTVQTRAADAAVQIAAPAAPPAD